MTRIAALTLVVSSFALAGCMTAERAEPEIRIQRVVVEKPVPCGALDELGAEPVYPDTDDAINSAEGIGPLAQLYRIGRAMRQARLTEYMIARDVCQALEAAAIAEATIEGESPD